MSVAIPVAPTDSGAVIDTGWVSRACFVADQFACANDSLPLALLPAPRPSSCKPLHTRALSTLWARCAGEVVNSGWACAMVKQEVATTCGTQACVSTQQPATSSSGLSSDSRFRQPTAPCQRRLLMYRRQRTWYQASSRRPATSQPSSVDRYSRARCRAPT